MLKLRGLVHNPVEAAFWVDVKAVDHADTLDQTMRVAAILPAHQFNAVGVVFIQDRIVKNQTAIRRRNNIALDVFPNNISGQLITAQKTIHRIVTDAMTMICKMGHREIGLRRKKKLTIIDSIDTHLT